MGRRSRRSPASNPYKKPDRFSIQAREDGYAARSVYKLQEIQRRTSILRRGQRVIDLGCAPGSWLAYAAEVVGPTGVVVGVDLDAPTVSPRPGLVVLVGSAIDVSPDALREALGGPADVVLSDMAPRTTGDPTGDHFVQIELAHRALAIATEVLCPGGAFVCKVFDGQDVPAYTAAVRRAFPGGVKRMKPEAVRSSSREFYLVGTAFAPSSPSPSSPGSPGSASSG